VPQRVRTRPCCVQKRASSHDQIQQKIVFSTSTTGSITHIPYKLALQEITSLCMRQLVTHILDASHFHCFILGTVVQPL
jgi:hypothetical protein